MAEARSQLESVTVGTGIPRLSRQGRSRWTAPRWQACQANVSVLFPPWICLTRCSRPQVDHSVARKRMAHSDPAA